MDMFKPSGITDEGTFSPDQLVAGDDAVSVGVTLKTTLKLSRGTLVYLKSGETQYEAYDGGTLTALPSLLGILVNDVDTTGGAASVSVYISGEFNTSAVTVASGGDLATVRSRLALQSLYLRDAVAA
jgi:hypothetical protein